MFEFVVETTVVETVDLLGHCDLNIIQALLWAAAAEKFGFEPWVEFFSYRTVVASLCDPTDATAYASARRSL